MPKWPKLTKGVHLIGWLVFDIMAWSSAIVLEDMTDVQRLEKEMVLLTENEIEVSAEPAGISGCCGTHLMPVTRITIKVGMCLWPDGPASFTLRTKVAEDFFTKWAFAKLTELC